MRAFVILVALVVAVVAIAFAVSSRPAPTAPADGTAAAAPTQDPTALEIVFAYSSEKEEWITDATAAFNAKHVAVAGGKHAVVRALPMGSGECIDEILAGRLKAHAVSPASAAFIKLGNAKARAASGKDLVASTDNLVLSPVVLAMWKPMAEALGWPAKPVGWEDVLRLARDPAGWASLGQPQWGRFRFGHTHPEYSNSGLAAVFAEAYAAAGKVRGLEVADLQDARVADEVAGIEGAIVHYGTSTGFFGKKMFATGPRYLSAAVLYENMVIQSYGATPPPAFPVVAIYPKEGTFWSDHPAGIVEREWVGPAEREAAQAYLKFLLERPQQEAAMTRGFRPGSPEVALAAPIDAAHGIDPAEPKTTLEVPSTEVMDAALKLWRAHKKHSHVTLVIDTSGSMNDSGKLEHAREGAAELVRLLAPEDRFSLLAFNTSPTWVDRGIALDERGRAGAQAHVDSLIAEGGTALYDSIEIAWKQLQATPDPDRINAIVVLTDGADTDSALKLDALVREIGATDEKAAVKIFTIAYGGDANRDVLKRIADATQAKSYDGTTANIAAVFREISTFF
jgi:Ca-activated chloride channel family protein